MYLELVCDSGCRKSRNVNSMAASCFFVVEIFSIDASFQHHLFLFQEHYEIRLAELGTCICVHVIVLYSSF